MADLLQPSLNQLRDHIPTTEPSFVPLDLTYVVYTQHSTLSFFFALITFTPFVVLISLTTLILFRRELEAVNQCCGLVLSTMLNSLLKHIFAQERPVGSSKQGHGMPSDHAQFMGFLLVYLSCWLFTRGCVRGATRYLLSLALLVTTALVAFSRIHLNVHTPLQVSVGVLIGLVTGTAYFLVSFHVLYPRYDAVLTWRIMRWLCMKDMSVVPDVLTYEWESWLAYKEWLERRERRMGLKGRDGDDDVRADGHGVGEAAASDVLQHHRDRAENGVGKKAM